MKHVLIISGRDTVLQYLKDLPVRVTLIQDSAHITMFQRERAFRIIEVEDLTSEDKILELVAKINKKDPIDCVTTSIEFCLELCGKITDILNITGNPLSSILVTRNKILMREKLKNLNIPSTPFAKVESIKDIKKFFIENKGDAILKPYDGVGSIGIFQLSSINDIDAAWKWAHNYGSEKLIIEGKIEGNEYSAEGVFINGVHKILAITRKYTTGAPHYIEVSHQQPININNGVFRHLASNLNDFFSNIDLKYGVTHTEFKIQKGIPIIIETHPRYGGDRIWELLLTTRGISLQSASIASLLQLPIPRFSHTFKYAQVKFVLPQKDEFLVTLDKMNLITSMAGFVGTNIKMEHSYYPAKLTSSRDRIGYILFGGDTLIQAEERINSAMKTLEN